jgi:hypothetical protein
LWPPKGLISANLPVVFREKYPSTRVIIDATEIFADQPCVLELQQFKNHNTFKGLIGISLSGVVILFPIYSYPGCISDKELTHKSGIH